MAENTSPENEAADSFSVLVTDAVNSAGLAAVRAFASAGHTVAGVVHTTAQADLIRKRGGLPVFIDITRPGEIAGIMKMVKANVIAHTAPQSFNEAPFLKSQLDPAQLLAGTQAALDAAGAAGGVFFIHTSFAFLYKSGTGERSTETSKLAIAKSGIIAAGRKAEKLVQESSVDACILRAGFVYGAGSTVLPEVADALQFGRALAVGGKKSRANWIHSVDLAQAMVLAAASKPSGEVFNIVDNHPTSPMNFLDNLAGAIGLSSSNIGTGLMAMLGLKRVENPLADLKIHATNSKAKAKLGWQPKYPEQAGGIEQMLISWRAASA